jgi:hypothetical protein
MRSSITNTQINTYNFQMLQSPNPQASKHKPMLQTCTPKALSNTKTSQDPLTNQQAIEYLTLEIAWVGP